MMLQMMLNDIATVHQAMVTRSNDAKGHGHIVPHLNRQQKTGDGYPAQPRPGELLKNELRVGMVGDAHYDGLNFVSLE